MKTCTTSLILDFGDLGGQCVDIDYHIEKELKEVDLLCVMWNGADILPLCNEELRRSIVETILED